MTIDKNKTGDKLTIALKGRLDTTTAPQMESVVREELADVKELVIDLSGLDYMSSAGLRVMLAAQKKMNTQGTMVVKNVNEMIKEVFDITGFSDILTIE